MNGKKIIEMRKVVIILSFFILLTSSCVQASSKQKTTNDILIQNINDTVFHTTVEDTVRYQIGGKLYGLNFSSSDSITVIKAFHHQTPEKDLQYFDITVYREYHFIVHNRYSNAHFNFADTTLNSIYDRYMTYEWYHREFYESYLKPRLDSIQSKQIAPAIKDFNGFWVYLTEYNGNYYLDDKWDWHSSFLIADSIFTPHYMDGPYHRKIIEVISLTNGISILYDGIREPVRIELFDKSRDIYRFFENGRIYFITPARAIHNFEIIQYTNNTGDLI